jgi:predicted dienelactone hydrolase
MVMCGEKILARGNLELNGLSMPEHRIFQKEIDLSEFQPSDDEIMWRFRGEIYDAKLGKTFGPMVMRGAKWDPSLIGVGYHIAIRDDGSIHTERRVKFATSNRDEKGASRVVNPFPPLTGSFPVGVRSYFWIDETREEMFTTDPADKRHVFVMVWYPAVKEPNAQAAPYIQHPEMYDASAGLSRFAHWQTNSFLEAPLSAAMTTYPVILFSHGRKADCFSATFLMEQLASHGYVVFSIGHTFFNGIEIFPDGYRPVRDFFPKMEEVNSQNDSYQKFSEFVQRYTIQPLGEDTQFVLDQVERLSQSEGTFFYNRLDPERTGICGWSIGGVNAAHMCSRQKRLKAGINFDGTLNSMVAPNGIAQPFLIVKGDHPAPCSPNEEFEKMVEMIGTYERNFLARSKQCFRIHIAGARHTNFSDMPLYGEEAEGEVDTKLCHEIITRIALAFFDHYVLGKKGIDLKQLVDSYPEVTFELGVNYD